MARKEITVSEVKRYYVNLDHGTRYSPVDGCDQAMNKAEDFDRVTAERDALQQRLTAADERADMLETALKKISVRCLAYIEAEREMPEPSVEVCQMIAEAALKPAEVEPYKPFLSADRQPGTPVKNNLHYEGVKPAEGGGDEAI